MWAVGLMATAGLGLNGISMNVNAKQTSDISGINREVGELSTDIKYIKEAVDQLREAQGIKQVIYATSSQAFK